VRFSHLESVFKHPVNCWFLSEITLISERVSHSVNLKSKASVTNESLPYLFSALTVPPVSFLPMIPPSPVRGPALSWWSTSKW
jgi:hypothetical protein